jgi:transmembrane sensor
VRSQTTNEIEEAASEWLVRRDSGHWTDADQASFVQWINSSPLNRVAFLRLELAWESAARLKALGAGIHGDEAPPPGTWNLSPSIDSHRCLADHHAEDSGGIPAHTLNAHAPDAVHSSYSRRRRRFRIAITLVLAILAGVGALEFWDEGGDRYATAVGGIASVPLQDGSKITLNTNSEVRIAFMEAQRRVDLKQGEAFFEVAPKTGRPFVVQAGKKRVIAIGTRFSVRRDDGNIEVMVSEGTVRIEDATRPLHPTQADPAAAEISEDSQHVILLSAGGIARTDGPDVLVQHTNLPEIETHLAWRSGVLVFRDQRLADAVAEFNRYNVRQLVIADPAVAALKIEGSFRTTNVEAFVRLLETGFPVRATIRGDEIVLSSK